MGERQAKAYFLGRRRYEPIHALQQQLVSLRADGHIEDLILLVEHEPVVTLGRAADAGNVLFGEELLAERGVDLVQTGRGGDVTYHGPGQLVCYPILDLKPDRCDVRRYVRSLAEVMILLARELGVESGVVDGLIGVWVDRAKPGEWAGAPWAGEIAKLGAIGVRLSRWVTMHGFAFNLSVDLASFGLIVPCGIRDHGVTSIEELVGRAPAVRDVALGCHALLSRGLELSVARVEDISDVSDLESALPGQARASFGPAEQEKPAAG
ncbi:lipoyl(octanoyl) transferase LipB [Polyangium sp. 15x6]|uniref:lipoyl(octanoyl) transferase LipB n=1 Tax=Polyangium sp. 15x6 TaxID=3042687 RepID=UPI00249AA2C1|nr:lipoyl(octanoyl) transferase LipB [Polyangium sp. 15x6]MDI3291562.1 lipoyl(octanoyl) transferase LipB [Polyangium sp. 15x6]